MSPLKREDETLQSIFESVFFILYVCMHMNIRTLFTYRNIYIPNTYEYTFRRK